MDVHVEEVYALCDDMRACVAAWVPAEHAGLRVRDPLGLGAVGRAVTSRHTCAVAACAAPHPTPRYDGIIIIIIII